ncbi:MAG: hypothetical protein RL497_2746 [Pseudomonadota bacterium]|jgi:peptidoglycan/xylan/chitin deacetylase (PgdA/CDA1 family)
MSPLAKFMHSDARIEHFFSALVGGWATIFTLHRSTPPNGSYEGIDPVFLAECLTYAQAQGYEFVSLDELVERALRGDSLKRCLCFTLDDGFADQLDVLIPVLLRYNAKPTLFVITDLVDGVDWPWDNQLAYMCWHAQPGHYVLEVNAQPVSIDLTNNESRKKSRRLLTRMAKEMKRPEIIQLISQVQNVLHVDAPPSAPVEYQPTTWQQLRDYESQGLRVGCHTKTHFTFSALSDEEIMHELNFSKQRLIDEMMNPSAIFCYPSGTQKDFSERHEPLVQRAGFLAAVSTLSKNTCTKAIQAAPYRIQRIGMPQTLNHFIRYTSWFEYLRGRMG